MYFLKQEGRQDDSLTSHGSMTAQKEDTQINVPILPYQVHIDDRVKHGVVNTVVHVKVLVIVFPPGLHRQEPGVAALLIPGNFTGRVDQYLLLRDNSSA